MRRLPPGPPTTLFGFQQAALMRRDLIGFCSRLKCEYGDSAHFRLGPFDCVQFVHPEQVSEVLVRKASSFRKQTRLKQVFGRFEGNGLVVSDGEHWARQRRLVQPAFAPARLAEYTAVISEAAERMFDRWGGNATVDIFDEMRRLMLQIVTRTLFSTDLDDAAREIASAVDAIQQWSMREMHRIVATPTWLPLWRAPEARRAIAVLHGQVQRIVAQRRATPDARDDLLGRLLHAVDAEGDGRRMTDRQLQDELVTLLLAGHETSAAAATWTAWLLAKHPEIQESVSTAVCETLGDRAPDFADVPSLTAVEQAFKEAMRLYPPVYFLSREAAEPVEIGGFELRPGDQVFLVPYLTQRDARWFAEPEIFTPSRFSPESEPQLPAGAYFPFGAGPRGCVGRGLAMMEGVLVLAMILQRFGLEPAPGQGEPELSWQLSLHPRGPLRLRVRAH